MKVKLLSLFLVTGLTGLSFAQELGGRVTDPEYRTRNPFWQGDSVATAAAQSYYADGVARDITWTAGGIEEEAESVDEGGDNFLESRGWKRLGEERRPSVPAADYGSSL